MKNRDYLEICAILSWIEENLSNEINITIVSHRAGYGRWHFQRKFKKVTGITITKYIKSRRLRLSALELLTTSVSLIDLTYKYQFDSPQSFNRSFVSEFGIPPGKWRRLYNKYGPKFKL